MPRRSILAFAPLALLVVLFPGIASANEVPKVDKAWSRPTAVAVGVVYMDVTGGGKDARLTAARTPIAAKVEIHLSSMKDGMMSMREVGGVDVPAGKTVKFKTGGLHLMLMGLKKPLTDGMQFPVTLTFGPAGDRTVTVTVRRRAPK